MIVIFNISANYFRKNLNAMETPYENSCKKNSKHNN